MLKKNTSHRDSYYRLRKLVLFLIVAISLLAMGHAQEISDKQKNTIAEILQNQPRTNKELEAALKPALQDTILLNYFLNASRNKKYNLGEAFALNHLGTIYQNLSLFDKAI